ncbi:hypothetical protein JVU11DRAFT_5685 [Chiua virens]|nr:hypothetical protein JVU11DRAFT_5685 [Chiua virens]
MDLPILQTTEGHKILSKMLMQLRALESFKYYAIDEALTITLSQLPSLHELSGRLRDDLELEKVRPNLAPPTPAQTRCILPQMSLITKFSAKRKVLLIRGMSAVPLAPKSSARLEGCTITCVVVSFPPAYESSLCPFTWTSFGPRNRRAPVKLIVRPFV